MSKPNPMLAKIEARAEAKYAALFQAKMDMTLQMCQDAAFFAAHEALGLGPGRAERFGLAYREAVNWMARAMFDDQQNDKDFWYAKEKIDQRLKAMGGQIWTGMRRTAAAATGTQSTRACAATGAANTGLTSGTQTRAVTNGKRGRKEMRNERMARTLAHVIAAGMYIGLLVAFIAVCFTAPSVGTNRAAAMHRETKPPVPAAAETAEPTPMVAMVTAEPEPTATMLVVTAPPTLEGLAEPEALPPEEIHAPRYELTDAERDLVERIVMAEAGSEDFDGQRLVAQCILNACEAMNVRPDVAVVRDKYTRPYGYATDSVKEAVSAVFDDGDMVTTEPIRAFYAPKRCTSKWHESQIFVLEHGGHRFFKINQ